MAFFQDRHCALMRIHEMALAFPETEKCDML